MHNDQDRTRTLHIAAAKPARRSVDAHLSATGKKVIVAGSIGPTGELFEPLGQLIYSSALAVFSEQADALAEGGVDFWWIETSSSNEEVAAAIEAAKTTGLSICATMTFDTGSRSVMGIMPADFAEFVKGLGANFIGANCGIPVYVEGAIFWYETRELMAEYVLFARHAGATVIGGCCGTRPAYVAAMVAALDKTPPSDFD